MASLFKKTLISTAVFATGFATFARAWPVNSVAENTRKLNEQREEIIEEIKNTDNYKDLLSNSSFITHFHSSKIPKPHQTNHISQGLLFGPQHLEIDPIIFVNRSNNELQAYYHLGEKLVSYDGKIHNGVVATLLDEFLCFCGFHLLPSGKGVTAKLNINFLEDVKPDSTILLKAKVKEHKGRKVVIEGHVETIHGKPIKVADATCILVEPKWFKYFRWFSIFD